MKTVICFVVLVFLCSDLSAKPSAYMQTRIRAALAEEMSNQEVDIVERDIMLLEIFYVRDLSIGVGEDRESRSLNSDITRQESKQKEFEEKIPFTFSSPDEPMEFRDFSLTSQGIRRARGGIIISQNATLYVKTGIRWNWTPVKGYQFYLPFRYRSVVGVGFQRKF